MIGAIIGDIIGSAYEFNNINTKDFPLFGRKNCFTDDTVMTCAVAKVLLDCKGNYASLTPETAARTMQAVARRYPDAGYGARFIHWVFADDLQPYNSYGNGSAMRISPVGDIVSGEETKRVTEIVTAVSHNHPEGLKGAVCITDCMQKLKKSVSKDNIRSYVEENYYTLNKTCDDYRIEQAGLHGKEICQITVPQAIVCFLESTDFEDCIRNCVSIGGDSDTIAAIAGGLAEAYYGTPWELWEQAKAYLDDYLLDIVERFYIEASLVK